ncbi:hypothetical protein GCM10010245_10760 [Streptomyces spectabilis]|nr:hypothetical protein GCM10010245_10760 [Streptomyces spectabilis]
MTATVILPGVISPATPPFEGLLEPPVELLMAGPFRIRRSAGRCPSRQDGQRSGHGARRVTRPGGSVGRSGDSG